MLLPVLLCFPLENWVAMDGEVVTSECEATEHDAAMAGVGFVGSVPVTCSK